MSAFVDPGEPNPIAREAIERSKALRDLAMGKTPAYQQEEEAETSPSVTILPAPTVAPVKPLRTQRVQLDASLFTLELEVYDIQIRPNFISFSMPFSASVLEPKGPMDMTLIISGRRYPVIYVGGYFELIQHNLKVMSFLRDLKAGVVDNTKHDERREDASSEDSVDPLGEEISSSR